MKKIVLLIAAAAAMLISGCKDNGNENPTISDSPELSLVTSGDVQVSADGGNTTVAYTVANPAEDGTVSASCEADWITALSTDTPNEVSFTVSPNEDSEVREAELVITYLYNSSVDKDTLAVKIVQSGKEEQYPNAFTFEVSNLTYNSADVSVGCNYDIYWTAELLPLDEVNRLIGGKDYLENYLIQTLEYAANMNNISLGEYIMNNLNFGQTPYVDNVSLEPETTYCIYAIGMDASGNFVTEPYWAEDFTTEAEPVVDPNDGPYATASLYGAWYTEDLIAHNADYEFYSYDGPIVMAIDVEFNDKATGAYYAALAGDRTSWSTDELYDWAVNILGSRIKVGDPLIIKPTNEVTDEVGYMTVAMVAYDAEGNLGELSVSLIEVIPDQISDNMELFDQLKNGDIVVD